VVGHGETLASAASRGSPYRFTCSKSSGAVATLAFANFSQALRPDLSGGLRGETVDYSRVELSRDAAARQKLGKRLGAIGAFLEQALKRPQDIEGAVIGDDIFLLQTRPQQGQGL
jgi:phosphoglucan,water dikinase